MGLKELDLEFETEKEAASSNGDALDVDVDLSFSATNEEKKPASREARNKPIPILRDSPQASQKNVKNIEAARPQPQPQVSGAAVNELKNEIEKLKAEMRAMKQSNDVALAVSEAEKEYLVEYISNAKLLDHQVTQMLKSIHKKAPAVVGEVQGIKKYLQEFIMNSKPTKK